MKKRGSIYRKYVTLVVALVGGALLVSGIASMYRSYIETRTALLAVEREHAVSASIRIENFVKDIERQIGWTSLPQVQVTANPLDARRFDYLKLLRQVPAITEATYIDAQGRTQVRVSRLAIDELGVGADRSAEPRFKIASKGRTYFGPVYFRKHTEPYMAIAVRAGRRDGDVTSVEVNLKFIWEVVQDIRVGKTGFAYVVDGQGRLVAHPDISLVLQKTDLSTLPQVAAALARGKSRAERPRRVTEARDRAGKSVLTAYAAIEALDWTVFVEQSVEEAYAPLYASLMRTGGLLVAGLMLSMLAGLVFARRMVNPIRALQDGADALGAGDLSRRIEVRTGDELEALGERFNDMAAKLAASYAGLERKVEERTQELQQALEFQGASGEILGSISGSIADAQPVFDAIVNNVVRLFDTTFVVVQLLRDGQIEVVATQGHGIEEIARNYPRPVDDTTIGGIVMQTGKATQIAPILNNPDAPPATAEFARAFGFDSLMAAPMIREDKVVGAIVAAHRDRVPFEDKQVALIKSFADQAVIAIENARLFNETKEALEQQTATAEILRSISASPSDVSPVFEAILDSAAQLCDSRLSAVVRFDGGLVHLVAHRNWSASVVEEMKKSYPAPPSPKLMSGRVILSGRLEHEDDAFADPNYDHSIAAAGGWRRMLGIPIKRGSAVLGAVIVAWPTPGKTPERQVRLLETFAEQAAIAIENVRLFNETREALEHQKASAEVLEVISSSVADTQPVFDKILESCSRLFQGNNLGVNVVGEDGAVHLAAYTGPRRAELERHFPVPLSAESGSGAAILEGRILHYPDSQADSVPDYARRGSQLAGNKSIIFAPMLWEGKGIGAITVGRSFVGAFSEKEVALLRTFADQAVIAIHNVRLFNETKDALERQTATGEILRVMSGSQTDVQPVFDTIVQHAVALCDSQFANVFRYDGEQLHFVASHNVVPEQLDVMKGKYPMRADLSQVSGRVVLRRSIERMEDALSDPNYDRRFAELGGWRRMLGVPMIREGNILGAIVVGWRESGPVSPTHEMLLKTFADQAAIAIENVRLFNETNEALEQQTASAEVLEVISSSVADTQPVFEKILESCKRLFSGLNVGVNVVGTDGLIQLAAFSGPARAELERHYPVPLSRDSGSGVAILERRVIHYPDIEGGRDVPDFVRSGSKIAGNKSIIFAPMLWEGRGIGAVHVARNFVAAFTEKEIALLRTFADQAAIAIQNARLFHEIEEKSKQLEIADKHKSDFLANMSHELRTPLNAIIGFSEVLTEKMFGEVNEKQLDYLNDIHSSGKHLLALINDILDLSKIEAGRMELDLADLNIPDALSTAMTLVRERAQNHGIALSLEVDQKVGEIRADERKVKQVVLNLLSNAVKFTPDGGKIAVRARLDTDHVEVAVQDSGIGIAPEDQEAVFEEFKQVGRDYTKKAEGTGLGLALTRRIVELHGGRIWLESAPGKGSTFTFTLPLTQQEETP